MFPPNDDPANQKASFVSQWNMQQQKTEKKLNKTD
jgi:hypothetical protein